MIVVQNSKIECHFVCTNIIVFRKGVDFKNMKNINNFGIIVEYVVLWSTSLQNSYLVEYV